MIAWIGISTIWRTLDIISRECKYHRLSRKEHYCSRYLQTGQLHDKSSRPQTDDITPSVSLVHSESIYESITFNSDFP